MYTRLRGTQKGADFHPNESQLSGHLSTDCEHSVIHTVGFSSLRLQTGRCIAMRYFLPDQVDEQRRQARPRLQRTRDKTAHRRDQRAEPAAAADTQTHRQTHDREKGDDRTSRSDTRPRNPNAALACISSSSTQNGKKRNGQRERLVASARCPRGRIRPPSRSFKSPILSSTHTRLQPGPTWRGQ